MNDPSKAYNTDLNGLLQSANNHNATVYTGSSTLSHIALATSDYGHIPTLIDQVLSDFGKRKSRVQTPNNSVSQAMDKLVNIWKLQQELISGNKFNDFIVINHAVVNGKAHFDVHPGRTRLYFHNVYHELVDVLFIDYTNKVEEGGPFELLKLTDDRCSEYNYIEYRLCDDWNLVQMPINHLLVQPNQNEQWHWPSLNETLEFKLNYTNDMLTSITANDKPFMDYKDYVWEINTSR